MKNPKVTVIMTSYNVGKYLEEAIQSILDQTLYDFELLIFDDASTDNCPEIIRKFAKKDRRIITHFYKGKKSGTVFGNLNKHENMGLDMAKGKYIAILDGDDAAYPNRLQTEVDFLDKHHDIFGVGASFHNVDENGNSLGDVIIKRSEKQMSKQLPEKSFLLHSTLMIRNEKKKNYRYRDKLGHCNDYDFVLQILSEGKSFVNLKDILVKYRIRKDSISTKRYKMQKYSMDKAREFYIQRKKTGKDGYDNFELDESEVYEDTSAYYERIIKFYFKENNMSLVRENLKEYWKTNGKKPWTLTYFSASYIPPSVLDKARKLLWK